MLQDLFEQSLLKVDVWEKLAADEHDDVSGSSVVHLSLTYLFAVQRI